MDCAATYRQKRISMSRHFVNHADATMKQVRNTMLHEIAHALVGPGKERGGRAHDDVWPTQSPNASSSDARRGVFLMGSITFRALTAGSAVSSVLNLKQLSVKQVRQHGARLQVTDSDGITMRKRVATQPETSPRGSMHRPNGPADQNDQPFPMLFRAQLRADKKKSGVARELYAQGTKICWRL